MSNETTPERSPQTEPQPAAPAAEQPAAEAPKRRRTAKKAAPAPEAAAAGAEAPKPRRKRTAKASEQPASGQTAQGSAAPPPPPPPPPAGAPRYQGAQYQWPGGAQYQNGGIPYANRSRNARRSKSGDPPIPWFIVFLAFIFATPVGIGLFVLNVVLSQRDKFMPQRGARSAWQPQGGAPSPQAAGQPQSKDASDKRLADTLMIIGMILAAIGGFSSLAVLFDELWILTDLGDIAWFLEEIWPVAMMLFGGLACCFASHRVRTGWLTRRKIANIVGDADHMYIADIAAALGCSVDKCVDHLENCIVKGVFGQGAYLDMRSMSLVVRGAAPAPRQAPAAPKPEPEPRPEAAAPAQPEEETRYDKILKELRRINDAIPDEEMSAKISRLEAVSARIFEQIQDDPDKLPQLRKFMDYYLPTSLKLLDTYAELDAQGVEGANITESKTRIERSMDTLVTAFENQLDKLFQDDALDVSADIEVMEKMLSADGLVGDSDPFGLQGHR